MKPLDNSGAELRSTFSVAGEWPRLEVTFESRPCKNSGVAQMAPRRGDVGGQALIAAISGPVPRICITRFML